MSGLRARVRAELTQEIKRLALEQLRVDGATGLSLRAIARDLGMASSAVYRYFPARDELLTALIIDAYDALGARAEAADASIARDDLAGRFRAVALAAFHWAAEEPAQYALLFGTPVPGYAAPEDTIGPASRYTSALLGVLTDALSAGHRPAIEPRVSAPVRADLDDLARRTGFDVDAPAFVIGMHAWISIFGTISFLAFGHLHNVIAAQEVFFTDIVDHLSNEVLGPGTGGAVDDVERA